MTEHPIDFDTLNELKEATDEAFAAELITTFLEEAPGMIDELRQAVAAQDADAYRRAAHSIKSNAATFGATALAGQAREMELGDLPANGESGEIDALQSSFDAAAAALRGFVDG